jgi:hypothetical protein
MSYWMFIDDERMPTDVTWVPPVQQIRYHTDQWVIVRNFAQCMSMVAQRGIPSYISFDHDLGHNEPTGYDIARRLVQLDLDGTVEFDKNFDFWVHSQNPVGRENIQRYLTQYLEFKHVS